MSKPAGFVIQLHRYLVAKTHGKKVLVKNVCLQLSFGMQMFMLPFMALIFSYPCPGGGRKNGDTIALLSA